MQPAPKLTTVSGGSHTHDHSDKVGSEVVNLPRLGYLQNNERVRASVRDRDARQRKRKRRCGLTDSAKYSAMTSAWASAALEVFQVCLRLGF
jgi:hypothetical protein